MFHTRHCGPWEAMSGRQWFRTQTSALHRCMRVMQPIPSRCPVLVAVFQIRMLQCGIWTEIVTDHHGRRTGRQPGFKLLLDRSYWCCKAVYFQAKICEKAVHTIQAGELNTASRQTSLWSCEFKPGFSNVSSGWQVQLSSTSPVLRR